MVTRGAGVIKYLKLGIAVSDHLQPDQVSFDKRRNRELVLSKKYGIYCRYLSSLHSILPTLAAQ